MLVGGVDFEVHACLTASPGQVQHLQPQRVEAVGKASRVQLRQRRVADGALTAGKQAEVPVTVARDLQRPAVHVGLAGIGADRRGSGDAGKGQLAGERWCRCGLVKRVAHADRGHGAAHEAIHVGGLGAQGDLADLRGLDVGAAECVQRHFDAIGEQAQAGDAAEALGNHVHQNFLAWHHREAGRVLDDHAGGGWCQRRADDQGQSGAGQPVGNPGHDQVVAGLAGTRRPADGAGKRIEAGTIGQAGGTVRQYRTGVRIDAGDLEAERTAQQCHMVGHGKHRCPVHIGNGQAHTGLAGGARGVADLEAEAVVAGLPVTRRPFEDTGARVET